ncbi:MAG: aminodeoxychorismate synthase component I [Woeseiaceae bacterium]
MIQSKGLKIDCVQGRQNLLALHQLNPTRYPFLLESVANSSGEGESSNFDILFAFPQETLSLSNIYKLDGISEINGSNFLSNVSQWWKSKRDKLVECKSLPFSGGWFLYLGYELAKQVEPLLSLKKSSTPIAYATRIPAAIIYDHNNDCTYSFCEEADDYLKQIKIDISNIGIQDKNIAFELENTEVGNLEEENQQQYLDSLKKVKQYIVDGDVFQVNLSRLWQQQNINISAGKLYQKLKVTNPAPFSGLATYKDFSIISSSPERLISIKNGVAQTRPIAGTRKRESNKKKDDALKQELMEHPKERAEHIMLIDLERNDLGRICVPGTIKVDELMVIESYAHVHHIVSNICGELREDILPGEVIKAVFPGGTITGCPKVRCMEIISELETEARGAYTGSMGYLNHNGDMDINILIRTMTLENNTLSFRAGAGLVADSIAESELEETRHKARGLLLALK